MNNKLIKSILSDVGGLIIFILILTAVIFSAFILGKVILGDDSSFCKTHMVGGQRCDNGEWFEFGMIIWGSLIAIIFAIYLYIKWKIKTIDEDDVKVGEGVA